MDRKTEWGEGVFAFVEDLLEGDLHGKRVLSLANATLGVMVRASLAVGVIGRSLARARGLLTKHAVKQVDRLLSNQAIDPWEIAARWVPEVIGSSTAIQFVMDWTDFDADGQTTLALNKVAPHGRATPLLWLTVTGPPSTKRRIERWSQPSCFTQDGLRWRARPSLCRSNTSSPAGRTRRAFQANLRPWR